MRKLKGRVADGRVFEIRDIKADTRYLHADYEYAEGDGSLADDDRLLVFHLCPTKAGLPSFTARWDGGNRSILRKIRYDLDVDINDVLPSEVKRFKKGKDGYCGHHTRQVGGENKYIVHLTTPAGLIFDATITFTKHHAQLNASTVRSSVTLSTTKWSAWVPVTLRRILVHLYQLARSRLCWRS
jgi:hypothetical protein